MAIRWDKLTVKAQEAIQAAGELASNNGNPEILPLHLLASLAGDQEGVVVIPGGIANEVAEEAAVQTVYEDWVEARVKEGRSIFGLYPPNAENKARYEASKGQ